VTRWLLTILSFAAAVGVSVYVIGSTWPEEGAPLGLPWWAHLVLLAGVAFEILCRILKITFSAAAAGVPTPFGVAARTVLGGDFAASITPSRSGVEPARFLVLKEGGIPLAGALLIIFLELFLEVVSLVLVTGVLILFWHQSTGMVRGILATVALYSIGVFVAGAVAYALSGRSAHGPRPRWVSWLGIGPGGWRKVQLSLRQLRTSIISLRHAHRGLMMGALVFSVLHVLARLLPLPIIVYSYGERGELAPLLLWPMVLLYGASVAPAPGGGGVVEIAFKAALGGVLPVRLLAASLIWWRVYTFYIYVVIGAFSAGRTVMRALRQRENAAETAAAEALAGVDHEAADHPLPLR
jgi:glycosyltransferase 2 family protein